VAVLRVFWGRKSFALFLLQGSKKFRKKGKPIGYSTPGFRGLFSGVFGGGGLLSNFQYWVSFYFEFWGLI